MPVLCVCTGNPAAAATKFLMIFGAGSNSGNWTGSEARGQTEVKSAGVLSNVTTYVGANTTTGTSEIRVRINGANGNSLVSWTSGVGEFRDVTNTDSFSAGDKVCYSFAGPTTITVLEIHNIGALWSPTSGSAQPFSTQVLDFNGITADQFFAITSIANSYGTTESSAQVNIAAGAVLSGLWGNHDFNTRTGGVDDAIRSRVNGANGNCVVTLTLGVTAEVEDISNTDALVAGDLVNLMFDSGAASGRAQIRGLHVQIDATDAFVMTGTRDTLASNDVDCFLPVRGASTRWYAEFDTEANMQQRIDEPFLWSNLWGNAPAGVINIIEISTRINGAPGNQIISWENESGEKLDAVNTDAVAANDLINFYNDAISGGSGIVRAISSLGSALSNGGAARRRRLLAA